jgi:hypothetical protein
VVVHDCLIRTHDAARAVLQEPRPAPYKQEAASLLVCTASYVLQQAVVLEVHTSTLDSNNKRYSKRTVSCSQRARIAAYSY